jgi:DNA polymerase
VHHLSCDIETFSSVDLTKSGLYKYAQSPDFEVLLISYSIDGGPVVSIDLINDPILFGNTKRDTFLGWLCSPDCTLHAYNAAFEWYCLCTYMTRIGWPYDADEQLTRWRCTMLHGLYCGYPGGLAAIGPALKLPQDKQKAASGKALIRFFCNPCKPTTKNGRRNRNLPHHDPARWKTFKDYNVQDVVTEMEVERRLSNFPVPDAIQKQWETDMRINARGVAIDRDMLNGALWCAETVRQELMTEAVQLSGLDNPNSIKQLSGWLEDELDEELTDLNKQTVKDLLGKDIESEDARRMLEIRQELGKTSTKKYNAMETALCDDGRVRGMLQFYGANRTGRWAGRIVQVQNLPQTHLPALELARDLVKNKKRDHLHVIFGSVPDTLSQLIRTAFVPGEGRSLIDADFSAIEARVIAWLAREEWVLDVFRTHGKIYEACASQMFGVPIDLIKKGKPEYELRQKGKVATLALGYQGSTGALIQMGALRMGLTEEELPDIVSRWRAANPRIKDLWYAVENAAISVIESGRPCGVNGLMIAREYDSENGLDFMTILLPSGRKLYYVSPYLTTNRWNRPSLGYYGMDQTTKKWTQLESYGGKLVENCVQAIARDCLAEAIERVELAGFPVAFHVHDEVVIDYFHKLSIAENHGLEKVCRIMAEPVSWAPDLPLGAEGWTGMFYKKE